MGELISVRLPYWALLHEADQAVTPPGSHLTYATRTVWGMPWWVMRFNARQRTPASVAC
jgi:hypothetical protein